MKNEIGTAASTFLAIPVFRNHMCIDSQGRAGRIGEGGPSHATDMRLHARGKAKGRRRARAEKRGRRSRLDRKRTGARFFIALLALLCFAPSLAPTLSFLRLSYICTTRHQQSTIRPIPIQVWGDMQMQMQMHLLCSLMVDMGWGGTYPDSGAECAVWCVECSVDCGVMATITSTTITRTAAATADR